MSPTKEKSENGSVPSFCSLQLEEVAELGGSSDGDQQPGT